MQPVQLSFFFRFGVLFSRNVKQSLPEELTLLLASWLSWQDLAQFLLHLGNHGSHGKILTKILLKKNLRKKEL